jgi:CRP-like cAMP-binding protein
MPVKDWLPAAVRSAAIDRKLKSGETLFRLGDKTAGLCEVIAGRVRLARVDRSGREIVLHVAGPGETVAEASLFASSYHCDAIASTDAVVRIYPKPAVFAAFEKDPKAAQAFAATLARQVMNLTPASNSAISARRASASAISSRSMPAPTDARSHCAAR